MQTVSGVSYEDFQNISGSLSENSSQIVSGSTDLEKINVIQDSVDLNTVPSGSEYIRDSGSYSSGSFVYNYYILNHDIGSGSVSSDQNVQPIVQVPSGVDYTDKIDNLTTIHMYILLFVVLIFIVTIFYRFRMKGGLR